MLNDAPEDSRPVRDMDDLVAVFHSAEKPPSEFRLGTESEKFGVHRETFAPLSYDGEFGVVHLFEALEQKGWQPERESPEGPVIALRREGASITLEPGAQFELSGSLLDDVHAVERELEEHIAELAPAADKLGLVWLGIGFHPLARQADLPWVPKQRYSIMREYLPPLGNGAHDMMRRSATVQVNYDYASEEDAMRKLVTSLVLSPLIHAMTANSPFIEARRGSKLSQRGDVWLRMDPSRSGLIRRVLDHPSPGYRDYAEWALDAGMFLFKRGTRLIKNTGQSFRDFMANGYDGERATLADWKLHLNTLFPEVRLKNTIEVRACDSLPLRFAPAVPALFTGFLYDDRALTEASALARRIGAASISRARSDLVTHGLATRIGGEPAQRLAEELLDIAGQGLDRRARLDANGNTERVHLKALTALNERGCSPAHHLLRGLDGDGPFPLGELVRRTRIDARE